MHPNIDLTALRRRVGYGADEEALVRGLDDRLWPAAMLRREGREAEADPIDALAAEWREQMASPHWDSVRVADRRELAARFSALGEGALPILLAAGRIRRALLDAVAPTGDELSRHELQAVERLVDVEEALVLLARAGGAGSADSAGTTGNAGGTDSAGTKGTGSAWSALDTESARRGRSWEARMAPLGTLSASLAHELRNPLGVIDSSVFLLRKHVTHDPRAVAHLERIAGQVRISTRIIDGLLEIVRDRPPGDIGTEVAPVIESAREAVALPEGTRLEVDAPADGPLVRIDPHLLRQILVNLLANAAEAAGPGGRVRIEARQEPDSLAIRVSDSGPGVDPELADRIFEPLVTSKPGGVGLGLPLCRTIAERHGGSIALAPTELGGATFVVRLPTAAVR